MQLGQPITPDNKALFENQALDDLINERLKITTATQQGYKVSDDDIKKAILHLESQNKMAPGDMAKKLAEKGIAFTSLTAQIKADLLWLNVIKANTTPQILAVSDADLSAKKQELRQHLRKGGTFVSEIIIPDETSANDCYQSLVNGANFQEMVAQYSMADSKNQGGLKGWITDDMYTPDIISALKTMQMGTITAPLKLDDGYLIALVQEQRPVFATDSIPILDMIQMGLTPTQTSAFGNQLMALDNCEDFKDFAEKHAVAGSIQQGAISPQQLPVEMQNILNTKSLNQPIGPVSGESGDLFFMKCSESEKSLLPSDDEIKHMIITNRQEALSTQLLKKARKTAVIEEK